MEPSSKKCFTAELEELQFQGRGFIIPSETPYVTYQEHIKRYAFAVRFVKDKKVLDVACGVGYGSSYLAREAASVIGVDISPIAIAYARKTYLKQKPNLAFVRADASNLPFTRDSLDVIISFETIEHLTEYRKFLAECRRVLRSGSFFICSTPNKRVTSAYYVNGKPSSRYHIKEFLPEEFHDLLCEYFTDVSLYGQHEVNLIRQRFDLYIRSFTQTCSQFFSSMPKGETMKALLRKIYKRGSDHPAQVAKDIGGEILDSRFGVDIFRCRFMHAPQNLIAICKKE